MLNQMSVTYFLIVSQLYLIDEVNNTGKGGNTVVSMLHHFLVHRFGEKSVHFYCDNCSGQNKNQFLTL